MMGEYGRLTEHAVGVILKEMVRRAIEAIQAQQFSFESVEKVTSYGGGTDFVTTADRAAQEIYLGMIRECLPGFGVIAEEDELHLPCELEGERYWITVDPLDGTRAFMRRQSHGIGTMVSMVSEHEVVAAYVGDVTTREMYGYRPGSESVHRITKFSIGRRLEIQRERRLGRQYVLLHNEPSRFSERARGLFAPEGARAFRSFEITRGSIGIEFSRLWKGEVGGIMMLPGVVTPWDFCPILGISQKLGFVFLAVREQGLVQLDPAVPRDFYRFEDECVIVHRSRVEELREVFEG